jgi:hypothetical protein
MCATLKKKCRTCKKTLPESAFFLVSGRINLYTDSCKVCVMANARAACVERGNRKHNPSPRTSAKAIARTACTPTA